MPITRQSERNEGIFTIREYRYDSGLVEISFYVPEVLSGAGPILRGVISRQPVKGGKFVGYTSTRNRVAIGRKKQTVIDATMNEILSDMRRDGSIRFYS
jgi:hypothetical protein